MVKGKKTKRRTQVKGLKPKTKALSGKEMKAVKGGSKPKDPKDPQAQAEERQIEEKLNKL